MKQNGWGAAAIEDRFGLLSLGSSQQRTCCNEIASISQLTSMLALDATTLLQRIDFIGDGGVEALIAEALVRCAGARRMEQLQVSIRDVRRKIDMVKALPVDNPESRCLSDLDKQHLMLLKEQLLIMQEEEEHMPFEVGEPIQSTAQWQTTIATLGVKAVPGWLGGCLCTYSSLAQVSNPLQSQHQGLLSGSSGAVMCHGRPGSRRGGWQSAGYDIFCAQLGVGSCARPH
ncbi:hypothetical protein HaLaN_00511, partial [Haematococcus lacustris]